MPAPLEEGVYEELVTAGLTELIDLTELTTRLAAVDPAEAPEILARHLEKVTARALESVTPDRRLGIVNEVLSRLIEATARATGADLVSAGPRLLLAVGSDPPRPQNPLRRADLLINARQEPALHEELAAEMASADQVELLCAFIKWQGLRLLLDPIAAHLRAGRQLRVITTTYVGATERRALDELVAMGAEVKISYETRTTRLHAKAWLFGRRSGWDTAYVSEIIGVSGGLPHARTGRARRSRGALLPEGARDGCGVSYDALLLESIDVGRSQPEEPLKDLPVVFAE